MLNTTPYMDETIVFEIEDENSEFIEELKMNIKCDEDEGHLAVIYCARCEANLCVLCCESLHSRKVLSNHVIVRLTEKPEPPIYCYDHPQKIAEIICKIDKAYSEARLVALKTFDDFTVNRIEALKQLKSQCINDNMRLNSIRLGLRSFEKMSKINLIIENREEMGKLFNEAARKVEKRVDLQPPQCYKVEYPDIPSMNIRLAVIVISDEEHARWLEIGVEEAEEENYQSEASYRVPDVFDTIYANSGLDSGW